jgi:hypothetical protein
MVAEDRCRHMMFLFSYFVPNFYYIIKMWHLFLYHNSSYVWDLILAHIWFTSGFALKSGVTSWLDPSKPGGTGPGPCTNGPPHVASPWSGRLIPRACRYHMIWSTTGPCAVLVQWFLLIKILRVACLGTRVVRGTQIRSRARGRQNPKSRRFTNLVRCATGSVLWCLEQPKLGSFEPNSFHFIWPFLWAS